MELPTDTLVTMDLAEGSRKFELHGLLGSDVLSKFDVIQVDYGRGILSLNPPRTNVEDVQAK